jgi:hypothetical protein
MKKGAARWVMLDCMTQTQDESLQNARRREPDPRKIQPLFAQTETSGIQLSPEISTTDRQNNN